MTLNATQDPRPTFIYALLDPTNVDPRVYVGQTKRVKERLNQHLTSSGSSGYRGAWLGDMARRSVVPEMAVLEVVPAEGDWGESERFWVASLRAMGVPLLNRSSGGEAGGIGLRIATADRLRIAEEKRGSNFSRNKKAHSNNRCGFKGVSFKPGKAGRRDCYVARITVNGTREPLGCYGTAKEAALAYDEAARKAFGGDAALNFPKASERTARRTQASPEAAQATVDLRLWLATHEAAVPSRAVALVTEALSCIESDQT